MVVAACALDPLTSASLTLVQTRQMVAEMLEAERPWLPQFEGKAPRQTPPIPTPPGTPHADVPLDPALAVANRFGELADKASE
jgi:alpha-galactosidase